MTGRRSGLEIVEVGWSTTVQDSGRPGLASIGVSPSGALDAGRRALVNRLVGNAEDAPVLETAGGLRLRATGPCLVASSAEAAPRALRPGEEFDVSPSGATLWAYLAVRGGLGVETVLGSASQDTLSGLGSRALAAGAVLPIGPDPGTSVVVDHAPVLELDGAVAVWPGPRLDWFTPATLDQLIETLWRVSSEVSRVGARLAGPPLQRAGNAELPSEGLVTGAIQVPPDGRPVVMLADHPTTGGYPVLAVVDPTDVATVAQRRPGAELRFRRAQTAR